MQQNNSHRVYQHDDPRLALSLFGAHERQRWQAQRERRAQAVAMHASINGGLHRMMQRQQQYATAQQQEEQHTGILASSMRPAPVLVSEYDLMYSWPDPPSSFIVIDSRQRDRSLYPSPSNFVVQLPRKHWDMCEVRMAHVDLPRTFFAVGPHNDTLYLSECGDATPTEQDMYVCRIPHGRYELVELSEVLAEFLPSALVHPAVASATDINPQNTYGVEISSAHSRVAIFASNPPTKSFVVHGEPALAELPVVTTVVAVDVGNHLYRFTFGKHRRHNLATGTIFEWLKTSAGYTYTNVQVSIVDHASVECDPDTNFLTLVMPAGFTTDHQFDVPGSEPTDLQITCRLLVADRNLAPFLGFGDTLFLPRSEVLPTTLLYGSKLTLRQAESNDNGIGVTTDLVLDHYAGLINRGTLASSLRLVVNGTQVADAVEVTGSTNNPGVLTISANEGADTTAAILSRGSFDAGSADTYVRVKGVVVGSNKPDMNKTNHVFVQVTINGVAVGSINVLNVNRVYERFLTAVPMRTDVDESDTQGYQTVFYSVDDQTLGDGVITIPHTVVHTVGLRLFYMAEDNSLREYDTQGMEWSCTLESTGGKRPPPMMPTRLVLPPPAC